MKRGAESIAGVGIDAVELERAARFVRSHAARLRSFFLPREYRFFSRSRRRSRDFALLFAAKEACSKAAGVSVAHPRAFRQFSITPFKGSFKAVWLSAGGRPRRGIRFYLKPFRYPGTVGVLAIATRVGIA